MRFIDELYALYKDQLTGDENEAIALILNVLSEHDRKDLLKLLDEMNDEEVKQMFSLYLVELFKMRMIKDGLLAGTNVTDGLLH